MNQKPGLIEADQLRELAPRRKVLAGVVVLIVLQLLNHFEVGPDDVGVDAGLLEVLLTGLTMYWIPERKERS